MRNKQQRVKSDECSRQTQDQNTKRYSLALTPSIIHPSLMTSLQPKPLCTCTATTPAGATHSLTAPLGHRVLNEVTLSFAEEVQRDQIGNVWGDTRPGSPSAARLQQMARRCSDALVTASHSAPGFYLWASMQMCRGYWWKSCSACVVVQQQPVCAQWVRVCLCVRVLLKNTVVNRLCNATIAESHELNCKRDYYLIPLSSPSLRGSVYAACRHPADKRLPSLLCVAVTGRLSVHLASQNSVLNEERRWTRAPKRGLVAAIIGKKWERNVHEVQRRAGRKLWAASDVYLKSRLRQETASGEGSN